MTFLRTRLRARLVLVALIAVAPAVGALTLTQSLGRQSARDRTLADNLRLARLAASQQAGIFDGARRLLITISEFAPLRSDDPRECRALLPAVLRAYPDYFNLTIVNHDGSLFCSAAPVGPLASARGRAWFERAIERRTTAIGDYQLSATTGRPAIVVAHPVLDGSGRVVRVLAATIGLEQLNGVVAHAELPRGAIVTLFDRSRTILARYPDGGPWLGKKAPDPAPVSRLAAGAREDTSESVGVDGVQRLYVTVPVQASIDTGLHLGMGIDHATAFRDADRIFRANLWVLVIVLAAAVCAAVVAGQLFVLEPIKALKAVTGQLAAGDLSARTHIARGIAGIGELEEAVDTMAAALDSRQHERDRAEAELRESEDRYRLLFARNPHPMWVYDAATLDFLEVNEVAVARYGYSRQEFLAMRITDIRPEEELPRLVATLGGQREPWMHSNGWRHRLKSGAIIDVEISSHTLTFLGKLAVLVTAQDVTDRKHAESALLERIATTALTADVGFAMNRAPELQGCLQSCAEALVAYLDAAVARIWTVDSAGQTLELQATAGAAGDCNGRHRQIAIGEPGIGRIAQQRRPHFTNDAIGDPEVDEQDWMSRESLRTFVGCPLIVESRIVGVLALFGRAPLSEVTMTAVASAADLIALGIARHQGEAARRLLASIVANSDDAIIGATLDGIVASWNGGAERLFGYDAAEVIGRHIALLCPPDRLAEGAAFVEAVRLGRQVVNRETFRQRKDGSVVPVSLTLSAIRDSAGQITGIAGTVRDITDRLQAERAVRDAEERMRFALEASQIGVWEANLKNGVAYWSDTCQAMHGLVPGSFGNTLESFTELIHPEDREQVLQAIDLAIREHKDAQLEYRTASADGAVRWISSVGRFSCDASGMPTRGAGIVVDVTERRSLEEQLRQAQKMEAVGQLAGGIAHDFNNLLTAILGFSGFLAESLPESDERRADVNEIRQAAERAAALTRQLLAFSRKQILAVRVLNLGDVVGELTPMLRRLLGESIDLTTTLGDRGLVKADPGQLQQVIVNLAVNAHDAICNSGRLTIHTSDVSLDDAFVQRHPSVRPGPHVMLTVTDTGHGMDAATQKRIFEPFFTTKPQGQGTGLGLATVYGIVKQSGGSIWVDSQPGRGTTFTVYLPRTDEREEAERLASNETHTAGGSETVLLIEDEALVREFVYKVLTRRGYSVHAFGDPTRAIAYAEAHPAPLDLVLSDVVLPDMSGKTMVGRVLAHHPESKTLFMSGYADHAIVQQGILDPGTSFLQKPFTPEALGRKVRDVLDTE